MLLYESILASQRIFDWLLKHHFGWDFSAYLIHSTSPDEKVIREKITHSFRFFNSMKKTYIQQHENDLDPLVRKRLEENQAKINMALRQVRKWYKEGEIKPAQADFLEKTFVYLHLNIHQAGARLHFTGTTGKEYKKP